MCLILFAHEAHPEYRLVLAANRDEFYGRPTAAAAPWAEAPWLIAGRDLRGGGTWMGVTRTGRWAALTNYRDPLELQRPAAPSRGQLVSDFLLGQASTAEFLEELAGRAGEYNGFNLVVSDRRRTAWYSNRAEEPRELEPGVYGLSNALLDTPWPKVVRGKRELARLLGAAEGLSPDELLHLLLDRAHAADHELPSTGVDVALERALSASFIATPDYGTRASTALLIGRSGLVTLVERTFHRGSPEAAETRHDFQIQP